MKLAERVNVLAKRGVIQRGLRCSVGAVLGSAALIGCGVTPAQPTVTTDSGAERASYAITVPISASSERTSLEQRYGGRVAVWRPEAGFAILGLNKTAAASLRSGAGLSRLAVSSLEPNKGAVSILGMSAWSNGMSAWSNGMSAWSNGMSAWSNGLSAWSNGMSAWSNGTYAPVSENTQKWTQIHLQQAQSLAPNVGAGVKVAVIDTGVDMNHVAFSGALAPAADLWDYVGNDANPNEEGTDGQPAYGHGSSVAAIVLQIAPAAKIMAFRVLGSDGSGDVIDVASAINRAVDQGAKVINLSLGLSERSTAIASSISYATSHGVMVVTSSGNTGDTNVVYPAADAATTDVAGSLSLSVGSVDSSDAKSGFSTYGPSLELVGPGEQVFGPVPGNRKGGWSGTSMVAPMASGGLALALGQTLSVAPTSLANELKASADSVYTNGLNSGYIGSLGTGRINLEAFINRVIVH